MSSLRLPRMHALTDCCRAIWRGYKEIKDAGGWVSLVFAGSGIYRFCKYRTEFGKNLFPRLERLRSSFEVAADTLHPEWRHLMRIIGQESRAVYSGHPHDWVVCDTKLPVTLKSTYAKWDPEFQFAHLKESLLDWTAWGVEDPRLLSSRTVSFCSECGHLQSNSVTANHCRCFPELYGGSTSPIPVQVYRTPMGKNNGLIARCVSLNASPLLQMTSNSCNNRLCHAGQLSESLQALLQKAWLARTSCKARTMSSDIRSIKARWV